MDWSLSVTGSWEALRFSFDLVTPALLHGVPPHFFFFSNLNLILFWQFWGCLWVMGCFKNQTAKVSREAVCLNPLPTELRQVNTTWTTSRMSLLWTKTFFSPYFCWKMKQPGQDLRVCHLTPTNPNPTRTRSVAKLKNFTQWFFSFSGSSWKCIVSPETL